MIIDELYQALKNSSGVSTDSRQIKKGELFFALKGANFNGNVHAAEALARGAYRAVIDDMSYHIKGKTIVVEDTLLALQQLSQHHRRQFEIPVIAITGSNGKTTSKELTQRVLSKKYNTLATFGNLNNHIGVPLTLLRINSETGIAVIEMGANHQGEIALLCDIAAPTHGLISSIGKAHLEGFGGFEGVKKGKGELYDYLLKNGGTIFLNSTTPYLLEMLNSREGNIIKYGDPGSELTGEIMADQPFVKGKVNVKNEPVEVGSNLIGGYNFQNILNAFAVGLYFNVPVDQIKAAIESYLPDNNRSQILQANGYQVILDAYNANPSSLSMVLGYFSSRPESKKVAIIGDMFELGTESGREHQSIVDQLQHSNIDTVVLVGPAFCTTSHPGKFLAFKTTEEAYLWWKDFDKQGSIVLIKGSRGMQLEKLAAAD